MSGSGDSSNDTPTYDPNVPISVLGDAPMPPWRIDPGQPSIFGDAFNPKPWTLADSTIHGLLDPADIATIDFGALGQPNQPQPSQPDASGFYGLTPWQPNASSLNHGDTATNTTGISAVGRSTQPSSSEVASVGEYILPGVGKTYLDPQFADKVGALIDKAQDQNIPLRFSSGYRDPVQQAALKNDPTAITPANQSLHSAGLSVDVNWKALSHSDQTKLLSAAADAGLSWGGNFSKPDRVHFYSDPGTNRGRLIDNFSRGISALQNQIPDD